MRTRGSLAAITLSASSTSPATPSSSLLTVAYWFVDVGVDGQGEGGDVIC